MFWLVHVENLMLYKNPRNGQNLAQVPFHTKWVNDSSYFAAVAAAAAATSGSIAPAISLTEKALKHLNKMRAERDEDLCLRIGVKQGGCSGMSYTMEFESRANASPDDSIVEYDGFAIGNYLILTGWDWLHSEVLSNFRIFIQELIGTNYIQNELVLTVAYVLLQYVIQRAFSSCLEWSWTTATRLSAVASPSRIQMQQKPVGVANLSRPAKKLRVPQLLATTKIDRQSCQAVL
jgi:iron-sulfur cluster assembly accessory protein